MHKEPLRHAKLAALDKKYLWHPFTQMADWIKSDPIVLVEGHGAVLTDAHGRAYLDANSSIWTNLHGHGHPWLNQAIDNQLGKIAHTSALGFASEPASLLGERLVKAAVLAEHTNTSSPALERVFFSDNGSTAMEVSLKLAYEFARRSGRSARARFLSLSGAYHGDTVGAVSMGHIDLFHKAYSGLLFKTDKVPAPYCYRCPHNRAKPERADARTYAKCNAECLTALERKLATRRRTGSPYAGFVFEPLMQGAAGMIAQPSGWLKKAITLARDYGALLIADEVMTGFGRMGTDIQAPKARTVRSPAQKTKAKVFACQLEGFLPDFMALAKGLTGGYLPMAATLTTGEVFDAFLGRYEEFKTFFHGHSFTGNQLGAASALASMDILQSEQCIQARIRLESELKAQLQLLWDLPQIGDIRQVGLTAGIEVVQDWRTRKPYDLSAQAGIQVCRQMAKHGVLTRPIGNVIVLMPPYCTTAEQLNRIFAALRAGVVSLTQKTE